MINPKVYILILNYNGWADTIECLESVLRNNYHNYQVVVIDNSSPNNSMEYIKAWAEGKLDVWIKPDNLLRHLSRPPIKKPIPYIYYTREEAERGGKPELETKNKFTSRKHPLIFIQSGGNLGFAGGSNIGMRYAFARNDFDYIWILNNDTVVEGDTLKHLIEQAENKKIERVGIMGSKLLYYDNPRILNGVCGKYNKWLAIAKHIGVFEVDKGQYDSEDIKMDYIIGSSMMVSRKFLQDVSLMCEDYFLYFEELDWAIRGKKKGWNLGYCWKSRVYHKEGSSIGSSCEGKKKSELADYYGLRNRIVFTKKFYPKCLWSVYLGFIVVIWNRVRRGQIKNIKLFLKKVAI